MYNRIYRVQNDPLYLENDTNTYRLQIPENELKSQKSSRLTSQSQLIQIVTNTQKNEQYQQITSNTGLASENWLIDLQIVQEENVGLISQLQVLQLNNRQQEKEIQEFEERQKQLESKLKDQILRIQLENDINFRKVEYENVKLLSQVEVYQKKQQQYEILIDDYLAQIDKMGIINNSIQQQLILVQKDTSLFYKDQDIQIQKLSEMNQQLLTQIAQLNNQKCTDSLQIKDLCIIRQTLQVQVNKHQDEILLLNDRLNEIQDQNSQLSRMNSEYLNQITILQTQLSEVQSKLQLNTYERDTKIRFSEQQSRQSNSTRHIEELNSKILSLNTQINQVNQQKQQLQQELYQIKKQLQQQQEDQLSIQSRQSKSNQQQKLIVELEERIIQFQKQLENESLSKSVNNGDLDIKNKQIIILEQNNSKLQQQLEQLNIQMEEEKNQLSDQTRRVKQLKNTEYDFEYRNSIRQKQTLQQELSKANQKDQIIQFSNENSKIEKQNRFIDDIQEQLQQYKIKYEKEIKDQRFENQQLNSQLGKVTFELQQIKQKYSREMEDIELEFQRENQRVSLQVNDKVSDLNQLELNNKQLKQDLLNLEQKYEKQLREANIKIKEISDDLEIMIENYKKEKQLNQKLEDQNEDQRKQLLIQVEEIKIKTERLKLNQLKEELRQKNEQINQIKQLNQQLELKIDKFEKYLRDLEDQLQQLSRKEEQFNYSKNQSLEDSLNVKIMQLQNNLVKAQKKEDQLIQCIKQLEQQQNSFRNSQEQSNLEQKNNQMFEEIQILVQTIKNQDFEIQTLKNQLNSYQREVSFMKEVVKDDSSRLETSLQDDQNRRIIELENKCALLLNENTRLNLLKAKQVDEWKKRHDILQSEFERSLNFREQNQQNKNIIMSSNFGQISNAK
ncbi:unnamed protein product [Paramecium sonneborni]|uniref:Uncharacterized protein n=1 Tax=Paramecium sonneborni TaxID=65129 RepID=A0A8S1PHC5_9CILI|nr:unnamed protein product [Paramecium sonneborni]